MRLFNSLTSTIEEFIPIDSKNIKMYVCGPTTYDDIHLGNARTAIVFDLLSRMIRNQYGYGSLTYITNFTDIDEKIINSLSEKYDNFGIDQIINFTDKIISSIKSDWTALNVNVNSTVRVTESIEEIFSMIQSLIKLNHAYRVNDGVVFDISSNPNFGKLTGQTLGEEKDFALWKLRPSSEFGINSPFGYGIPGWSIECSAMIKNYLGDVIDIHGGGIDLKFPHHENEIAQSTCANHTDKLANYFVHSNMVTVDGVKMSKSLGNHITIKELLKTYTGSEIRFDILRTKYSGIMNFTYDRIDESKKILSKLVATAIDSDDLDEQFLKSLNNDLNTPVAIMRLQQLHKAKEYAKVGAGLKLLGVTHESR